jgi:CheY-like chemotaxis protein
VSHQDVRGAGGPAPWLVGDGEIVELIRSKDWSGTPLGPIESWPESLRTTVSLSLGSAFPINVIWGPGAVQIWNDAYSRVFGEKHPREFGSDYRVCWASAWPAIGDAFEAARAGRTVYLENQPMFLDRMGHLEETWFTFSLSPIRDEMGAVAGLFHPVAETTPGVLADRRTRALRDLAGAAGRARGGAQQATELALEVLSECALDLPYLLLYLVDADGGRARISGHAGLEPGHPASPREVDLADPESPVADVVRSGEARHLTDLGARYGAVRAGPHDEPLEQSLLLPIRPPGAERPAGVLVAGVSTRLPLDETYRGFFDLVAQGVTSALANAIAYEKELVDGPPVSPRAPARATVPARALNVLVVDDTDANRRVTALLLGKLGHTAESACNGAEAVEAVARTRYDLVLMDMQMPVLNGLDATRAIRRRQPAGERPLILGVSGFASDETRHECLAAGMNGYLVKPVTLAQLSDAIAQLAPVPPDGSRQSSSS